MTTLLRAVRQRVEETSIRGVAEELGMSPSGLHVLLSGSRPHPATREKLVMWYLASAARDSGGETPSVDVDAAVRLLVHYIGSESRREVRTRRAAEIITRLEAAVGEEA